MILTKSDFLTKYENVAPLHLEFERDRVTISSINDWNVNKEIQKYVASSENCYFISLEFKEIVIKIE